MTNVLVFGSCMSNITAAHLVGTYGWSQTHSVHHNRSDAFVEYFIDRVKCPIPMETIESMVRHKPDVEKTARQFLRNQYEEHVGYHDLMDRKKGVGRTMFTDLTETSVDVILLDNLMDVSTILMYPRYMEEFAGSGLFLNPQFYENEKEIASQFQHGRFLSVEESVRNWKKIINWFHQVQPKAKIFFFPYHFVTSEAAPDRYGRIRGFYEAFSKEASSLSVSVVPPLVVASELTKGEVDWPHFQDRVYRALAGHVFLQTEAQYPAYGQPYRLPPVPGALRARDDSAGRDQKKHPYQDLPDSSFWRRSVAVAVDGEIDPVTDVPFRISRTDRVATAGSCFAQHISRTLVKEGFSYLVAEPEPESSTGGVFSARYGNVYTTRQLVQLFDRAYGSFEPVEDTWQMDGGRYVDPFRPRAAPDGLASPQEVRSNREAHLRSVRTVFEDCDVFVFTLGLTEAWISKDDGAAVPLAPGVVGGRDRLGAFEFQNLGVTECVDDLNGFLDRLQRVNPAVRVILTVSPVPLIATREPRHVLVATSYSKAVLRVVADEVSRARSNVAYFPSYEIITGLHTRSRFYEDDLREVRAEGVASVMAVFKNHYLAEGENEAKSPPSPARRLVAHEPPAAASQSDVSRFTSDLGVIICDEAVIDEL